MFKDRWDPKYMHWGVTAFCVVCASLVFFFLLLKLDLVLHICALIFQITMPIIYGLVLCYIMRPIYNRIEMRIISANEKNFQDRRKVERFAHVTSTIMTLLFMIVVVVLLVQMILPQILATIYGIVESMPDNLRHLSEWLAQMLKDHPQWEKPVMAVIAEVSSSMQHWAETQIIPQFTAILTNVSLGVIGIVTAMLDVLVGIIICVYALNSKERFCSQGKKLCYAVLPRDLAEKAIHGARFADTVYSGFISGKLLDSLIIGILCFVCLTLMDMPYVMLISVIVGVTNIIPFFGPFVGAIPSALLILLVSPKECLYFLVFILLLQQLDGNVIGPKILGGSTGLSSFWVIFAILVGGGLFGFPGMVLGVPTFSVLYHFIKYEAEKNLQNKGMPVNTKDYNGLESPAARGGEKK